MQKIENNLADATIHAVHLQCEIGVLIQKFSKKIYRTCSGFFFFVDSINFYFGMWQSATAGVSCTGPSLGLQKKSSQHVCPQG